MSAKDDRKEAAELAKAHFAKGYNADAVITELSMNFEDYAFYKSRNTLYMGPSDLVVPAYFICEIPSKERGNESRS